MDSNQVNLQKESKPGKQMEAYGMGESDFEREQFPNRNNHQLVFTQHFLVGFHSFSTYLTTQRKNK